MNRIIMHSIFFLFAIEASKAQGIKFETDLTWKQIQAKSKSESKFIFMDIYTTWCGPCKAMNAETFPKKEVGDFINDKFISVKVQLDQVKEDSEFVKSWYLDAKSIDQQYKITTYPTVLFFSPHGKLVHRSVGYKDALGLIEEARKALDPQQQYYSLLEAYNKCKVDTALMKNLVFQADAIGDKPMARKVAEDYASHLTKVNLYERNNLLFISRFLNGAKDGSFNVFLKEAAKIDKIVGQKNFSDNTVMGIIYREEIAPYDKAEKPDWEKIEEIVVIKYGALGEEQVWGNRAAYYFDKQDWLNLGKYYKKYFEMAIPNERSMLHINNLSWAVFEHVLDTSVLNVAIKAMDFNLDKYERYKAGSIDTYANLLYKVGRKQEAIGWQEIACRLSNREKGFVETLEKMKAGTPTWPTEEPKK